MKRRNYWRNGIDVTGYGLEYNHLQEDYMLGRRSGRIDMFSRAESGGYFSIGGLNNKRRKINRKMKLLVKDLKHIGHGG